MTKMTWEEERHRDMVTELTRKYGRGARVIVPVLAEELDDYVAQLREEGWKVFPIDTWYDGIVIQATREVRVGTKYWGHDERQDFEFRTTARKFMHYPEWLRKTGREVKFRENTRKVKKMKLTNVKLTKYDKDFRQVRGVMVDISRFKQDEHALVQLEDVIGRLKSKGWELDESLNVCNHDDFTTKEPFIYFKRKVDGVEEYMRLSYRNPQYDSVEDIIG